jgi:hypothetical protein
MNAVYQFWDSSNEAASGHSINQPAGAAIDVTTAQLTATNFVGGSVSDDLWVRANDGMQWSAWLEFHWFICGLNDTRAGG